MTRRADTSQLSLETLFAQPAESPGSLDISAQLCHTLSAALKAAPDDRFRVAAEMSRLTGQDITKFVLDTWTAESKERHRFPFEFAPAFEAATGSYALQQLLASKRGTTVMVGEEVIDAEIGRLLREETEARERRRSLEKLRKGL